ncbi:MAG: hypothetical protein HYS13_15635 [Planctomycetia bacterium]|nr:hypothetical protein [Planctomycetia bacterium]
MSGISTVAARVVLLALCYGAACSSCGVAAAQPPRPNSIDDSLKGRWRGTWSSPSGFTSLPGHPPRRRGRKRRNGPGPYLGIHWQFDADEGVASGQAVGDHVFERVLEPLR